CLLPGRWQPAGDPAATSFGGNDSFLGCPLSLANPTGHLSQETIMKSLSLTLRRFLATVLLLPALAFAQAVPGKPAPDFNVPDATGKIHSLADYKGEWLVLEWFNKDCPYVKKHYGSGNMQSLQATYTAKGVKWLTIISSAEGKQGYLTPEQA